MTKEFSSNTGVPEERIGKVHDWGEMSSFLSNEAVTEHKRFLRGYFRAQLLLSEGNKVKARQLFKGLDKITGYSDFEDSNQGLLRTIDMAVGGKSRW